MNPTSPDLADDAPVAGRESGLRRRTHPAFEGTDHLDPLAARLQTLLRLHPGVVSECADDVAAMDTATVPEVLKRVEETLELNKPALPVIPL
jgi:hypothetical protein